MPYYSSKLRNLILSYYKKQCKYSIFIIPTKTRVRTTINISAECTLLSSFVKYLFFYGALIAVNIINWNNSIIIINYTKMVFFIALSNAWIAEIISYHSVPWIGAAKHRNHIKIYCAQAMQVNSIFQILQANERSFIHFVVHILDTQIFAERW